MPQPVDNKPRCFGSHSTTYAEYHDTEWGVPVHDDRTLFEMLILEGAHAGLSWETVLMKRGGYRDQFHNFDVEKVAAMTDHDLFRARSNAEIIRHKLKIESTRKNARIFIQMQEEYGSFSDWLWDHVDGTPIKGHWKTREDIPAETPLAKGISKDLKKRGMSFVGPTIIYAYLQAIGVVNDHFQGCWCYEA